MILEVVTMPRWKSAIMHSVARVIFWHRPYVLVVQNVRALDIGDKEEIKTGPCVACNGVGRIMLIDTYEVVDCPKCHGRG